MKKIRKGKKLLLILLIAIVVIVAAVLIIKNVVNKEPEPTPGDTTQVIPLPELTYSGMEVRNIYMEYLEDDGKTMVTMEIKNTTTNKVENEHFNAILVDAKGNILGQLPTFIEKLDVGEQISVSVVYKGDLTSTTNIKLEKKQ